MDPNLQSVVNARTDLTDSEPYAPIDGPVMSVRPQWSCWP